MNRVEKLCLAGLVALPLGVGTTAFVILTTPTAIACDWVDQSAAVSVRLHCAHIRADRQTPESLIAAIDLLGNVSADEPLKAECDRALNRWIAELKRKAEAEFQAGNLEKAVSILRSISDDAKIQAWQTLWSNGENILKTAQTQIDKRQWQQAFQTANRLQQVENEYWAKEQYTSLIQQIQSDRELRGTATMVEPVHKDPEFSPPTVLIAPFKSRVPWQQDDSSKSRSVQTNVQPEQPVAKTQPPTINAKPNEVEPEPPTPTQPVQNSEQVRQGDTDRI